MSKSSKKVNRGSKSSTRAYDHGPSILDVRRQRVWKACERCRMKKTKCDGELICQRCKESGLVCTAGSRKKFEYKQIPRGYAEVLENTHFVLKATVQKLYFMVRNSEPWDIGEPELNANGSVVIHDIASKLGCIRASPDLPYAIPNGAEEVARVKEQLESSGSSIEMEDDNRQKHSNGSSSLSSSDPYSMRRSSSSESYRWKFSKNHNPIEWDQQQSIPNIARIAPRKPDLLDISQPALVDEHELHHQLFRDTASAMLWPIYTNYQPGTPNDCSPFNTYGAADDTLGPADLLEYTAQYMKQQTKGPRSSPVVMQGPYFEAGALKEIQTNEENNTIDFTQGTIRPDVLWNNSARYNHDQIASVDAEDYRVSTA